MPLKLYKMDLSPTARSIMMICEVLNVSVEMVDVDLLKREQLEPEFIKKNPLHTIPVLEEDDLYICDSHVILTYVTDKYGKDDSLYPKDLRKRALVDQKLHFDVLFFTRMRSILLPAVFEGVRRPTEKQMNELREVFDHLETFLTRTKFIALDNLSIADVAVVATMTTARKINPIDEKKHPKLQAWFSYMEKQPFYQKCNPAKLISDIEGVVEQYLDLQ